MISFKSRTVEENQHSLETIGNQNELKQTQYGLLLVKTKILTQF